MNYKNDIILTSPDFDLLFIPLGIIHDKRLTTKEKIYLTMYYQYGNNDFFADKEFREMCSKQTLCTIKNKLKRLNLIKITTNYEEAKKLVLEQKGRGDICEWCGCKTNAIQKHHYPIPEAKGGKKTVNICPNCHYEYHKILKYKRGV